MIDQATSSTFGTRAGTQSIAQALDVWCQRAAEALRFDWTGDARFHLGQARRALDRGNLDRAEREAARALELDDTSPWPMVVLGRCALARGQCAEATEYFNRAHARAPRNRYVVALLEKTAARRV